MLVEPDELSPSDSKNVYKGSDVLLASMGRGLQNGNGIEKRIHSLVFELDRLRSHLNTHEDYNVRLKTELHRKIRQEAYKHSVAMEIETSVHKKKFELEDEQRKLERHLMHAWDYLTENELTIGTYADLGQVVDPEGNNGKPGFRTTEVVIGEVSPAAPEKIPHQSQRLLLDIDEFEGYDLYRSVHAHLETALIHPWVDGNGRAARLLGDFTLQQRGLAPAVLLDTEKPLYTHLLREALKEQSSGKSLIYEPAPALLRFAEYIGKHSLNSMQRIERELEDNKIYYVRVAGIEKPIDLKVKHMLCGIRSRFDPDKALQVRELSKEEGAFLFLVKGPANRQEIRNKVYDALSNLARKPEINIVARYE